MGKVIPLGAEERVRRIKKAIRGEESYKPFTDYKLMEKFSMSHDELMRMPYERYLEFSKIYSLEKKEEKKKQKQQKSKMK